MEHKVKSQEVRQKETAEEYVPDEEARYNPREQVSEVKIGDLLEKKFRVMIVKMIQDLRKRMEARIEKMQKMFNKDL